MSGNWEGIAGLVAPLPLGEWTCVRGDGYSWEFYCEIDGLRITLTEHNGESYVDRFLKVRDTATGGESVYYREGVNWLWADGVLRKMVRVLRGLKAREVALAARDESRRTSFLLRRMRIARGVSP